MLAMTIWGMAVALEALILARSLRTGLFRAYAAFCVYVGVVFFGDATLPFLVKTVPTRMYRNLYWTKELICVITGYAVVMEIIEKAFAHFDGPKKLGRNAALITFAAIVGYAGFEAVLHRVPNRMKSWIPIEANLRGAELILLCIVIVVISYYRIAVGRNLKGIIVGYGICTVAVALNEAFRTFMGPSFQAAFSTIWSYSYIVSLLIWVVALWSYQPAPAPAEFTQVDGDYEALAGRTRAMLAGMRGYLRKAARP